MPLAGSRRRRRRRQRREGVTVSCAVHAIRDVVGYAQRLGGATVAAAAVAVIVFLG